MQMDLSFPTLLSILLFGFGLILLLVAIQPFTTTLGIIVTAIGSIGIIVAIVKAKRN